MGDISVLFVAIVRNDDPSRVIAAQSFRDGLSKKSRSKIEESIRSELGKSPTGWAMARQVATDPPAFLYSHIADLTQKAGRSWACVVCATANYSENNAMACAKEIAERICDSMDTQQYLEAWARKAKGGSAGGLTKKFPWLAGIREKWDKQTKLAEIQRDTELVKVTSPSHSLWRVVH